MKFSSAITQGLGRAAMVFVLAMCAVGHAEAKAKKAKAEPAAPAAVADERYEIKDGTVYDKKTDLTWSRCSVGKHWTKKGCAGVAKEFTFDQAQQLNKDGWRVPTKEELEGLIDQNRKTKNLKPYVDVVAFPSVDRNQVYWTSTPHEDVAQGWVALFGFGEIELYSRNMTYEVVLVHNGK